MAGLVVISEKTAADIVEMIRWWKSIAPRKGVAGFSGIGSRDEQPLAHFLGVVTAAGPDGEANFGNEQYWIKISYVDGLDSVTDEEATSATHITTSFDADADPLIIPATNLAELNLDKEEGGITAYQSGTHLLAMGTHVWGVGLHDRAETNQNIRWVFTQVPSRSVMVWVGEASGDGGKYLGNIVYPPATAPTPSGVVALADFGTIAAEYDCLILNGAERGQSTHQLTECENISNPFPGIIQPRKTTDGLHVVMINGLDVGEADEE